jgi:inner membrane transporter RhtA
MFTISLVLAAIVSVQLGSSIAKTLFPIVGPLTVVSLRVSIAALIMVLVFRPWRAKVPREAIKPLLMYGISLGLMNCAFYLALERIPLGICVALEFIGPLSVGIIASKRKIDLLWVFFAVVGIVLILPLDVSYADIDFLGIILALTAGLGWALYIVFGKRLSAHLDERIAAAWGMVIATIATWPVVLPFVNVSKIDAHVLAIAFMVAVLASAIPYTLEMFGLKRLSATTFGILMSIEPAMAAISGLLILNETLNPVQWLAIISIIVASGGSTFTSAKEPKKNLSPICT